MHDTEHYKECVVQRIERRSRLKQTGSCLPSLVVSVAPVPGTAVGHQHLLQRTSGYKGRNLGRRKGNISFLFSPWEKLLLL